MTKETLYLCGGATTKETLFWCRGCAEWRRWNEIECDDHLNEVVACVHCKPPLEKLTCHEDDAKPPASA